MKETPYGTVKSPAELLENFLVQMKSLHNITITSLSVAPGNRDKMLNYAFSRPGNVTITLHYANGVTRLREED